MRKIKSKYTSNHCHERADLFLFFQALTLSVDCISDENEICKLRDQTHVLYIGILPSRMHLVVSTTN